jgi:Uncharacterized conserved protein
MKNEIVNVYTLKSPIDKGGMGEVWLAENDINIDVAVKILREELMNKQRYIDRFEAEAKVMVNLEHSNICQVYGYSKITTTDKDGRTIENRPCIIMEYLEGSDLLCRMNNGEHLDETLISKCWNQLVDALNYTHKKGVVHLDIKPSNIFLTDKKEIKLLDFGIARINESNTDTPISNIKESNADTPISNIKENNTDTPIGNMGTPLYMSPEQLNGNPIDYKSDNYSLAITFYHLLTGISPSAHEPLKLENLTPEWRKLLQPYLEEEPENRPELKHFYIKKGWKSLLKWLSIGFIPLVIAIIAFLFVTNRGVEPPPPNPEPKIKIEWAVIPAGTFKMGSPKTEDRRGDDEYQHEVSLDSFYMSQYTITFEQYDIFCDSTGRNKPDDSGWGRGERPVINVSWEDAVAFTEWLGAGSRLPTEAEWEYACRAGKKTPFNTGNKLPTSEVNYNGHNPYGKNTKESHRGQTMPVGSFDPNAWGLYDMHGNVYEWCLDWYDEDYYSISSPRNPQGPSFAIERVLRGGSWDDWAGNCRSAKRFNSAPTNSNKKIGFRVVIPKRRT